MEREGTEYKEAIKKGKRCGQKVRQREMSDVLESHRSPVSFP